MPIYEYQCEGCGHRLEAIQKMTEPPLVECPQCGHPTLRKLVSAAGFQLKGSGWYATDFRNKGSAPAKPDAQPPKAEGGEASPKAGGSDAAGQDAAKAPAAGKTDAASS